MRAIRARLKRSESGQVLVEYAGTIWLVVLAALAAWELALIGWTAVTAANAARTAARAYSRVGDQTLAVQDAHDSLSGDGFSKGTRVWFVGERAYVQVRIPIVLPWLPSPLPPITQTADMPSTG